MRKFLVVSIPVATMVVFIFVMLSGNFLKKTKVDSYSFVELVEIVSEDINKERWEEAKIHADKLQHTWDKLIDRIQYSSEREEINEVNVSLSRLRGAILTNNKPLAIDGLYEAYEHWEQLGN